MIQARILAFLAAHWLDFAVIGLLAVVVIGWSAHERNVQAAKDAIELSDLQNQVKYYRNVIHEIDAEELRNKAAAEAQAKAGQAALAKAQANAKAHDKALQAALARAHKAIANVTCADQPLPDGIDL